MGKEKSINLYEGYRQLHQKQQTEKRPKWMLLVLPLALIGAVMLATGLAQMMENRGKQLELDLIEEEITALQPAYDKAVVLSDEYTSLSTEYAALALTNLMFTAHPALSKELMDDVEDCEAGVFTVSIYSYDDAAEALVLEASAPSVNEVPNYVERLRNTGNFDGIQYVGYDSDTKKIYYCTVGCTLKPAGTDPAQAEPTE